VRGLLLRATPVIFPLSKSTIGRALLTTLQNFENDLWRNLAAIV
jgi:hypothetical protein